VVFARHYGAARVERLFGALLRTILELAGAAAGARLAYIEASGLAVAVAGVEEPVPAYAALFLDAPEAGGGGGPLAAAKRRGAAAAGGALARALLAAFVDEHGGDLAGAPGHNLAHFRGFGVRVPSVARQAARAALAGRE
jgi:hypothetical protein